ncbi:MAG: hypothetical protein AB8B74_04795 [Crocinitomicaceae bacterium]
MRKIFGLSSIAIVLMGCSNYTAEQSEAATFLCDCMSNGIEGEEIEDKDILYYMCDELQKSKFDKTVFSDEGYAKALFEKCPDQNLVSEE